MKISDSAKRLRKLIEKAIADHQITREEYDMIIHAATDDANIDPHEKALLEQFHHMLDERDIKFVNKKSGGNNKG